jgi:hypothetical protein
MQMSEHKFVTQLIQSIELQVGSGAVFSTNRVQGSNGTPRIVTMVRVSPATIDSLI